MTELVNETALPTPWLRNSSPGWDDISQVPYPGLHLSLPWWEVSTGWLAGCSSDGQFPTQPKRYGFCNACDFTADKQIFKSNLRALLHHITISINND